ncbi:class I SAM-dependent methyltransferase [Hyunsoonleella flava]|uniref:Class I SAM-dependent methyltransferase n=1 Tax=Hyunsoonleella flava TaxID=2527939 RepID=A0A4Q9FJK6_9FLAO|nr:class I SAM-dependent methyltransferase [Hyunsoonleella flava]TBN06845.1 class I SAM-dependent methyltransferase [Hyunsoonleella flava]
MNKLILNTEIQEFIKSNIESDLNSILLKGTHFEGIETSEIVNQIEAKKRCKKKLPSWFQKECIYYPNKLHIEQTSSEVTAKYKSELLQGETIIDLTGGFGVDCYYFAKRFKNVMHCEINSELSSIARHNYSQLNVKNVQVKNTDGIAFLSEIKSQFDWIYCDPSRRHGTKGKVFFLKDCLPDIPKHLDLLFQHSNHILIKTSPLLDISSGINELKYVKSIHIVAVSNEVKELLWILEKEFKGSISINTVDIKSDAVDRFNFKFEDEKSTEPKLSMPLSYLYEPNAAILKSGAFHQVSHQLDVYKLHPHSHLYTSETLVDFPGRIFKIETVIPYNKKAFKTLNIDKANVTTRNFPDRVENIRKKLKIKDGGDTYLFFTTNIEGNKIIIACKKVKI